MITLKIKLFYQISGLSKDAFDWSYCGLEDRVFGLAGIKGGRMRRLTTPSSAMYKVFFLDTKLKCKLYIFLASLFDV